MKITVEFEADEFRNYLDWRDATKTPIKPGSFMSISELEFTVRTENCLLSAGIVTVEQLTKQTPSELLKIYGFGRLCMKEVVEQLARKNLKLAGNNEQY